MYFVIELQTRNGQTANLVTVWSSRANAEQKYHTILAAAAVSDCEKHAAVVLSDEGFPLLHQCYIHEAQA